MNIEELTKAQIILLTLLMSFVTSIATGIVTVSLLNEAPPVVQQTIRQVVERTVETVVPSQNPQVASVKETVKTVVVKEEDLITTSISDNSGKIVRIYRGENVLVETFLCLGFFIDKRGVVATDASCVTKGEQYMVATDNGDSYIAFATTQEGYPIARLDLSIPEGESVEFAPVARIGDSGIKLGQTVISLSGKDRTQVAMGIISGLPTKKVIVPGEDEDDVQTREVISRIDTTIAEQVLSGSPIINIFGEVIGIKLYGYQGFMPLGNDVVPKLEATS